MDPFRPISTGVGGTGGGTWSLVPFDPQGPVRSRIDTGDYETVSVQSQGKVHQRRQGNEGRRWGKERSMSTVEKKKEGC